MGANTLTQSGWRNAARPIIAKVLADNAGKPEKEIRAALRDAYPFGKRRYHPYKIWCSEIRIQMGKRPPLGTRVKGSDPRQDDLFTELADV